MKKQFTIINPSDVRASACQGHNDTLTILSGPYEGLQFRYDAVWLPDGETKLGFHYTPLNGKPLPEDTEDFENAIAHLLYEQMKENIDTGNIVFRGGLDVEDANLLEDVSTKVSEFKSTTVQAQQEGTIASQIMQKPGLFVAKENENAMSMLDRMAAEGIAAMKGRG